MRGDGFLAIWSDVAAADETDYLHWLTREHAAERIGVEGFLGVRVFRALAHPLCRVLILYELASPGALAGLPYLDRLNAPSPWSQRIMPILKNFVRGGGRRTLSMGTGRGGYVAALARTEALPDKRGIATAMAGQDRIAAVHVLETDLAKTAIATNEKKLRAQDQSFAALLLVEGLDQASIRRALAAVPQALPHGTQAQDVALYAYMFGLEKPG